MGLFFQIRGLSGIYSGPDEYVITGSESFRPILHGPYTSGSEGGGATSDGGQSRSRSLPPYLRKPFQPDRRHKRRRGPRTSK